MYVDVLSQCMCNNVIGNKKEFLRGACVLGGDFNARVGTQVPMVPGGDVHVNSHGDETYQ